MSAEHDLCTTKAEDNRGTNCRNRWPAQARRRCLRAEENERYMHLSTAMKDSAIRLLEQPMPEGAAA
jgi:hypothetical protein